MSTQLGTLRSTTHTGGWFYPGNPEGSEYRIADIAHALSLTCRFSGQCARFYSVAEHSVLVSHVAERLDPTAGVFGLLHDASEAYLADIPSPVKALPELEGYRRLEKRVMDEILRTFHVSLPEPPSVKSADLLVLRAEAESLGLLTEDWDVYSLPDCGFHPVPLDSVAAEAAFFKRFDELTIRGKYR
jgi:uncharacterized protein